MATAYWEKLKDPRWQKRRLEIMERDNFRCQGCGDQDKTLHVHHKIYERGKDPWDYEDNILVTYCEDCHRDIDLAVKKLILRAHEKANDAPECIDSLTELLKAVDYRTDPVIIAESVSRWLSIEEILPLISAFSEIAKQRYETIRDIRKPSSERVRS